MISQLVGVQSVAGYDDLKRLSSWFSPEKEAENAQRRDDMSDMGDDKSGVGVDPGMQRKMIDEMYELTKLDKAQCEFYLESYNWDVRTAIKNYYELLR